MYFASVTIPSINEDGIAGGSFDDTGIFDSAPGKLGEGFTVDNLTALFGAESVFLTVGSVPYPVDEEVGCEKWDHEIFTMGIDRGWVVGEIEGAVAIGEGHTSKVPEN